MAGLKKKPPAEGAVRREEIERLKLRLAEAEESLDAIRSGEVDALVVNGPRGEQVYTLEDADYSYRLIIEKMREGTITIDPDGLILYANAPFAAMLGVPHGSLLGTLLFGH